MAPLSSVSSAAGPFALQSLSDLDRRRQELYRRLGIRGAAAGRGDAAAAKGQPEEEAHDWEIVGEEAAAEKERAQLRRMAFSECGVPCSWRPAESQTVTIFDWDDTLLCTSFLVRRQDDAGLPAGGLLPAASLPAAAARCLRAIAAAGQGLLRLALQCGRTFIITNAVQGWVERSAALYAPELLPVLREVHIISARRSFEAQFPNEVGAWKVQAFLEVQRQLDVQRVTNLISIGDSNYEIEAVHAMGRQFKRATVKTVKLLENPRPEVLLKQLKLVAQKFKRIVEKPRGLQISLGPSSAQQAAASFMAAARGARGGGGPWAAHGKFARAPLTLEVATRALVRTTAPLGRLGAAMASVFDALDRNHDGVISRSEFNAVMAGTRTVGGSVPVAATSSILAGPAYGAVGTRTMAGTVMMGAAAPVQSVVMEPTIVQQQQAGYYAAAAAPVASTRIQGAVATTVGQAVPQQTIFMEPAAMQQQTFFMEPTAVQQQTVFVEQATPMTTYQTGPAVSSVVMRGEAVAAAQVETTAQPRHTIIREVPQVQVVEKVREVPQVQVEEKVVEVPTLLYQEKVVEVPKIQDTYLTKQVPRVEVQEVTKEVVKPVNEIVETIQEVPQTLITEVLHEVPTVQQVECIRQVPKPQVRQVEKQVAKPVPQYREKIVEVPTIAITEQLVEVPQVQIEELIREVPKPEVQIVQKQVEKPVVSLVEKIIEVPQTTIQECIVEVPQVEVKEVVKQVPKHEVQIVEKQVPKVEVQYVEKIVEVPQIVYEERIIEVPTVETREIIKQVAKPEIQYIDKRVPKKVVQYVEKIVEVPQVIYEERPIEVPQVVNVEAITQVPRPQTQFINKEVPKYILQAQEKIVEVDAWLKHERPVEVPVTQVAEIITQVPRPEIEYVDKMVPKITTEAREQIVEVPQVFYEERLKEVPQVQMAEVIKQVPVPQIQEVQKHIPKIVETKVIEKVVQVPSTLIQETAIEVPKVMHQEVVTQKASGNVQQRIIQTGFQYERFVDKEEVVTGVGEAVLAGEYNAQVTAVREFAVPSQDVEVSRVVTEELVSDEAPIVTTVNLPQMQGPSSVVMESGMMQTGPVRSVVVGGYEQQARSVIIGGYEQQMQMGTGMLTQQLAPSSVVVGSVMTTAGGQFAAGGQYVTTAEPSSLPSSVVMTGQHMVGSPYGSQLVGGAVPMGSIVQTGVVGGSYMVGSGSVQYGAAAQTSPSVFDVLDRNHDGVITRSEFSQAFR